MPTKQQFDFLLNVSDGANTMLLGPAGCGKTFCIERLREKYNDYSMIFTGTTGMSASNIGGVTVDYVITYLSRATTLSTEMSSFESIVIDECSMMGERKLLDLDLALRKWFSCYEYFGGKQIILMGDFLQLPPVNDSFMIFSAYFTEMNFKVIYINKIHRQNNPEFIRVLNAVRLGKLQKSDVEYLQKMSETSASSKTTILTAQNKIANAFNAQKLNALEDIRDFYAIYSDNYGLHKEQIQSRLLDRLWLAVGAKVMLTVNLSVRDGLVNGLQGTVIAFNPDPVVLFGTSRVTITKYTDRYVIMNKLAYERISIDYAYDNMIDKHTMLGKKPEIVEIIQYPLKLAWAITIHKSQGLTLDDAIILCDHIYCCGQFYTALSRVRSPENIHLVSFDVRHVRVNKDIVLQLLYLVKGEYDKLIFGAKRKEYERNLLFLTNRFEELIIK